MFAITPRLYSCVLVIATIGLTACVLAEPIAPKIAMDVDFYDNLSVAESLGFEVYGPDQIRNLFDQCSKAGVSRVYWRAHSHIANYPSKVNYNVGHEIDGIASRPGELYHSGALAAKAGVDQMHPGLGQELATMSGNDYQASAWVLAAPATTLRMSVIDQATGKILGEEFLHSADGERFLPISCAFKASGPSRILFHAERKDTALAVFYVDDVSVTGDNEVELVKNGGFENFKNLQPTDWDILSTNFTVLSGSLDRFTKNQWALVPNRSFIKGQMSESVIKHMHARAKALQLYDPLKVAVAEAKAHDIEIYGWIDPLGMGRLVLPGATGGWNSIFHEQNPQYRLVNKEGDRKWGQMCMGYEAVHEYLNGIVDEILDYGVDGIYIKTYGQHMGVADGNPRDYSGYVYNDIALETYDIQFGKPPDGEYNEEKLKVIHGEFFVDWLIELSNLVHGRGAKIVFSKHQGNRLEALSGGWPLNWQRLVQEKHIDGLMIEPRLSTDHKGFFESIDKQFYYASLCEEANVELSVDFYLNAVAHGRIRPESLYKGSTDEQYIYRQLMTMGTWPVDYVGIYEEMFVELNDHWDVIDRVIKGYGELTAADKVSAYQPSSRESQMNLAAFEQGAVASFNRKNMQRDASPVIDGELSDVSNIAVIGTPFTVQIDLPSPTVIGQVSIYPGILNSLGNPSGECGIRSCFLEGLNADEQWVRLTPTLNNISSAESRNARFASDYVLENKLDKDEAYTAIRLTVLESSDTGKRMASPDKVSVSEDMRVTYIREIKVFMRDQVAY